MAFTPYAPSEPLPAQAANLQVFRAKSSDLWHGQRDCPSLARTTSVEDSVMTLDSIPSLHCGGFSAEWLRAREVAAAYREVESANHSAENVWGGDIEEYLALTGRLEDRYRRAPDFPSPVEAYLLKAVAGAVGEGVIDLSAVHDYLMWDLAKYAVSCETFENGSKTLESVCLELARAATSHLEQELGLVPQHKLALGPSDVRASIHRVSQHRADLFQLTAETLVRDAQAVGEPRRAAVAPLAAASVERVTLLLREGAEGALRQRLAGPEVTVGLFGAAWPLGATKLFSYYGSAIKWVELALPMGVVDLLDRADMLGSDKAALSIDGSPLSLGDFRRLYIGQSRRVRAMPAPSKPPTSAAPHIAM